MIHLLTSLLVSLTLMMPSAPGPNRHLIEKHDCQPTSTPLVPPVVGYLIGLHSKPHKKLFYRSNDNLTSGLFWPNGGDWVLRYWCKR